ncbi:MAG: hypothetical protein Q8Q09_18605, partial [Deltaproteobacteria bacterium]|nr:hypothetical protein [Deltaproteobacteria bacterium]
MKTQRSLAWALGASLWAACSPEAPAPLDAGRDSAVAAMDALSADAPDTTPAPDVATVPDVARPDSATDATDATDAQTSCACGTAAEDTFDPLANTTLPGGPHHYRRFNIRMGVTVRVTGTMPLVVFAREPVTIAGTLTLSGADGREGACETSSTRQPGGVGGAGASAGGAGGARRVAALPGEGDLGGGAAGFTMPNGTDGDSAGGGGGGGGNAMAGIMGSAGACCPARCSWGLIPGEGAGGRSGRANAGDFVGGGGGGGGAYGRADNGNGGSGGGGGGAVRIVAPSITVTGALVANGGSGGSAGRQSTSGSSAECDGGAGGGGAGGTVWLQAPRVSLPGTVGALGGGGGITVVGATCGVGGAGGSGSEGVVRVDTLTLEGTSVPAPTQRGFDCATIPE